MLQGSEKGLCTTLASEVFKSPSWGESTEIQKWL